MEEKLARMTQAQEEADSSSRGYSYTDGLEAKCAELQEQVYEMEVAEQISILN